MCKNVLICFEKSTFWYSPIVRWATKSEFNHVLIAYPSEIWGGWVATDIQFDGVRPIVLEKVIDRKNRNSIFEFYKCKIDLHDAFIKTRNYVGVGYDIFGFFPTILKAYMYTRYKKLPKKLEPKKNRSRVHCSEFVTTLLKNANLPGTEKMIPFLTSPEDLRKYIISSKDLFELTKNPLKI